MLFSVLLAALASTAAAYEVTRPTLTQGWTTAGSQTLGWTRVDTDAATFAVVLTNVDRTLLPADILLAESVDGAAASSLTIEEPAAGWPQPGGSYRVNLVRDSRQLNAILAQSSEFNFTAGTSTGSTNSTGSTSGTTGGSGSNNGTTNGGSSNNNNGTADPKDSADGAADEAEGDSGKVDDADGSAAGLRTSVLAPAMLALLGSMLL